MKNKGLFTLVGMVLIGIGFLAIMLNMIGLRFEFLTWIDNFGRFAGFLIRIAFIVVGFVIIAVAQTNFEQEEA